MTIPSHLRSHPIFSGSAFGLMSGESPRFPASQKPTHENLVNVLRNQGIAFEETHGRYDDPERSVIIHSPTREMMHMLGKHFGQESVVYSNGGKHELLYTNGEYEGKSRLTKPGSEPISWFHEAPENYYTHLPNHGYFGINFDFDQDPQHHGPTQVAPAAPAPMSKADKHKMEPAFQHRMTGNVYSTGSIHNYDDLQDQVDMDEDWMDPDHWIEGFVDNANPARPFYDRKQAAALVMPTARHRAAASKYGIDTKELESQEYQHAPVGIFAQLRSKKLSKAHTNYPDFVQVLQDELGMQGWQPAEIPQSAGIRAVNTDRSKLAGHKDPDWSEAVAQRTNNHYDALAADIRGRGHTFDPPELGRVAEQQVGYDLGLAHTSRDPADSNYNPNHFASLPGVLEADNFGKDLTGKDATPEEAAASTAANIPNATQMRAAWHSHPHAYDWHDGHSDHHQQAPNLEAIQKSFGLYKSDQHGFAEVQPDVFEAAISKHPRQDTLDSPREYSGKRTFLSADRRTGYALKGDELKHVFSLDPGRGEHAVKHAIANGAKRLDTYDGKLPGYYARFGFKETARSKNWTPGQPDVVFMSMAKSDPGLASYAQFAGPYGEVRGRAMPSDLNHYNYHGKLPEIEALVKQHGFKTYFAGGKYGNPDLQGKNYNNGHLMITDPTPRSGGDFRAQQYTNAWRQLHELSHALTHPEINSIYGEARRVGKLGTHRTPNEAMRAVHWEWLAAHKQRELSEKIGVHVPDEVFHKELNTVMHDAVHRAVNGQLADAAAEGFAPHAHKVPLHIALDTVRNAAQAMGIQHPHGLMKKSMLKAWPKNKIDNQANAAARAVMEDGFLEQGAEKTVQGTTDKSLDPTSLFWHNRAEQGLPPRSSFYANPSVVAAQRSESVLASNINSGQPEAENEFWAHADRKSGAQHHGPVDTSDLKVLSPIMKRKSLKKAWPKGATETQDSPENQANAAAHKAITERAEVFGDKQEEQGLPRTGVHPNSLTNLRGRAQIGLNRPAHVWRTAEARHANDIARFNDSDHEHDQPSSPPMPAAAYIEGGGYDQIPHGAKDTLFAQTRAEADKRNDRDYWTAIGRAAGIQKSDPLAPKPQLHSSAESFMAALKGIPKGSSERGKFITQHMSHAPFISALQAHPQGKQIHQMLMGFLNSTANAGPKAPMKVVAKNEIILSKQGNTMSEKTYTPQEAVEILKKAAADKIKVMESKLQDLRKREQLSKGLVPPHKHNTGSPASAGMEDVPPSKLNPPGKNDKLVGGTATQKGEESSAHPPEETSGEISADDMAKALLCKKCGKSHDLEKGCDGMDKAELVDAKGNTKSNSEESAATMPDDESKHVNKPTKSKPGSGGVITKGKKLGKSLGEIRSLAKTAGGPPTAKPPSGTNMATKVPTSAPKAPAMGKEELAAKAVDKIVVPKSQKPKVPSAERDRTVQVSKDKTVYEKKPELEKGVLADIARKNNAGAPTPKDPGANVKLPSPAQQEGRANMFSAAMAGEYQPPAATPAKMATAPAPAKPVSGLASPKAAGITPKPAMSAGPVMNAARPSKPGIFGRLLGKK